MCRLPVKCLSKLFCRITTLQIWPYLGTSKCWGHSVLQMPALVSFVFDQILLILAGNEDMHKISDKFEFGQIGPLTTELASLEV